MVDKLWFKAKHFGWGWYPASWQGWAVTAGFIFLIITGVHAFEMPFYLLYVLLLTTGFIQIAYATGERPRWRWGK